MRYFVKTIALLGIALISLIAARPVLAFPPLPSSFYGTVKIDAANVPDGTLVKAFVNGQVYAITETLTYQGDSVYSLDVLGDDSSTTEIEGGIDGDTIVFRIGEEMADQTGTWKGGTNTNLNLTASTKVPQNTPVPAVTQEAATSVVQPAATSTNAPQNTPVPAINQEATTSVVQPAATSTETMQSTPAIPAAAKPDNNPINSSKTLVIIGIVLVASILIIALWLIFVRKPKG